jgi:hypothetical protein
MKLSSAANLLLLSSLSSLSSVSANPQGGDKYRKQQPDDDVEVVVRYRNEKGRDDLKLVANDGTVEKDMGRFKVAALKTKRSKINMIKKDPNIESVA